MPAICFTMAIVEASWSLFMWPAMGADKWLTGSGLAAWYWSAAICSQHLCSADVKSRVRACRSRSRHTWTRQKTRIVGIKVQILSWTCFLNRLAGCELDLASSGKTSYKTTRFGAHLPHGEVSKVYPEWVRMSLPVCLLCKTQSLALHRLYVSNQANARIFQPLQWSPLEPKFTALKQNRTLHVQPNKQKKWMEWVSLISWQCSLPSFLQVCRLTKLERRYTWGKACMLLPKSLFKIEVKVQIVLYNGSMTLKPVAVIVMLAFPFFLTSEVWDDIELKAKKR